MSIAQGTKQCNNGRRSLRQQVERRESAGVLPLTQIDGDAGQFERKNRQFLAETPTGKCSRSSQMTYLHSATLALCACLPALAMGCAPNKVPSEGPVTQKQLRSILPDLVCDRVAECDCPLDKRGGSDRRHCKLSVQFYLEDLFLEEDGGTEYDGDLAWECLVAAEKADCSNAAWVPLCDRVMQPLLAVGASCARDTQCKGFWEREAHCDYEGTCASGPRQYRGELGDGCEFTEAPTRIGTGTENPQGDAKCVLSDGLTCEMGVCAAVAAEGVACETVFDCTLGTYCIGGACSPTLELGDNCPQVINYACGFENYCNADGVCAPLKPIGAECASTFECVDSNCSPFGTCESAGMETVCEHFSTIEIED